MNEAYGKLKEEIDEIKGAVESHSGVVPNNPGFCLTVFHRTSALN